MIQKSRNKRQFDVKECVLAVNFENKSNCYRHRQNIDTGDIKSKTNRQIISSWVVGQFDTLEPYELAGRGTQALERQKYSFSIEQHRH